MGLDNYKCPDLKLGEFILLFLNNGLDIVINLSTEENDNLVREIYHCIKISDVLLEDYYDCKILKMSDEYYHEITIYV